MRGIDWRRVVEGGGGGGGADLPFTQGWRRICYGGSCCVFLAVLGGWLIYTCMCACTILGCIVIPLGLAWGGWRSRGYGGQQYGGQQHFGLGCIGLY